MVRAVTGRCEPFSLGLMPALRLVAAAFGEELETGFDAIRRELEVPIGFEPAVVEAAERSFALAYADAWGRAYAAAFDDWSHNVKPAIAGARLIDGNDDGVFEPGMTICVEVYCGEKGGREGVKLEDQVLITETGYENLTRYPFEEKLLGREF